MLKSRQTSCKSDKTVFRLLFFICIFLSNLIMPSIGAVTLKNQITGVKGAALENIEERLKVRREREGEKLTSNDAYQLFQQGSNEIKKALQPYGFFTPKINAHLVKYKNEWIAQYIVDPGKKIRITALDLKVLFENTNDPWLVQRANELPIRVGQYFSSIHYEAAKKRLRELAKKRGYLFATFVKKKVSIDVKQEKIAIILYLHAGRRCYFGRINFSSAAFSDKFLRRFLIFSQGEVYSQQKLHQLHQAFNDSGFFDGIEIYPLTEKVELTQECQIPIDIKLIPKKGKQYVLGLGYGTDTGFRGLAGVTLRHITQDGQHMQIFLKASELERRLTTNYIIPGRHPATDQYAISLTFDDQDYVTGEDRSFKFSQSYLTVINNWRQTIALNFLHSRSEPKGQERTRSFLLYPSIDWLRVSSDHALKPNKGYRLGLTLQGSSSSVFSSLSFFQARARAKFITTLLNDNRFVFRTDFGYIKVKDISKLPLDLGFYIGGADSVRGYGYRSIGPGRHLIAASAEYQRRLFRHFYGTMFYDVGSVNDNLIDNFKQGVGVGLMLLTTLGAVELTVAKGLNRDNSPLLVQFSLGPEL